MKYIPLFILIQLISAVLIVVGVPIIAYYAYVHRIVRPGYSTIGPRKAILHFAHRWCWLWDNEEDGIDGGGGWNQQWSIGHQIFVWSAKRNPVNGLRTVSWVSAKGRPLWRKTWVMFGKHYYFQAGWNGSGYPVLSGGANIYSD